MMKKGTLAALVLVVSQLVGCVDDDDDGLVLPVLTLTWLITIDGFDADCAEVGATDVEVSALNLDTNDEFIDTFDCEDFEGTTAEVDVGNYDVEVTLLDGNGNVLGQAAVDTFADFNEIVDLGDFEFAFDSAGSVSFRVLFGARPATTSNCGSTNPGGGAGVVVETIDVFRGSTCVSSAALAGPVGAAQVCGDPFVCQDDGVTYELSNLTNGSYSLDIIGYKGATGPDPYPCYRAVTSFTYSGSGMNLGNIVAPLIQEGDPMFDTRCEATKPEPEANIT